MRLRIIVLLSLGFVVCAYRHVRAELPRPVIHRERRSHLLVLRRRLVSNRHRLPLQVLCNLTVLSLPACPHRQRSRRWWQGIWSWTILS